MRRSFIMLTVALVLAAVVLTVCVPAALGDTGVRSKVLVRGAPIHGANGMVVDAAGTIHVASVFGRDIVLVNSRTGRIVDRLGVADGLNGADDVALAPDGSLYWTDILTGRVGHRALDGTVTYQDVAPFVNPIAFAPDGRLFVGQAFYGDNLYEIDPEFVDPPALVWNGSGVAPFLEQLNGFDVGPDGKLYAPQPFLGMIIRFDTSTWVPEVVAEGLPFPVAIEFNGKGKLFALLQNEGKAVRVNVATGTTRLVAKLRPGLDNLAFDARDRMYVSNANNGLLWQVLRSGEPRRLTRGGLMAAGGIAVLPVKDLIQRDRLYVADVWELKKFDGTTGRAEGYIAQQFGGAGIIAPLTVSRDGANLILSSWQQNAVQIWDPAAGTEVARWADFAVPMNAIRFGDDLVVAEYGTHSVVSQDAVGTRTTLSDAFALPTGLAAAGDDLYVADWALGTVSRVVDDGVALAAPEVIAGELVQPEGLAVDRDGMLLVVEAGAGRLTRIDPATGAKTLIRDGLALGAEGSPGMMPTWVFNGVAVGVWGHIYVTGDKRNVIYRMKYVPTP